MGRMSDCAGSLNECRTFGRMLCVRI